MGTTACPGTIHQVDLDGTISTQHGKGRLADIVLFPIPSNDPDDPLNWSRSRKLLSTLALGSYTLSIAIASAAIYSVLIPIEISTGLTLSQLNAGTGYMFLALGWGCVIFQPLALQYGKRPVYLFSLISTMAIMIWVPYATTNSQWIGSKILQGLFMAPIESLCEVSIADIYFAHERGTYIGLYGFLVGGGSFFASIIAGFINDGQNWQWVMYWCAIFLGVAFIFCFFCLEETNFDRPIERLDGILSNTATEPGATVQVLNDLEKSITISGVPRLGSSTNSDLTDTIFKPRSYLQRLSLLDKKRPFHLITLASLPFKFFCFPAAVFAGISYGSAIVWFNVINGTAGLILSSPPYNFSSALIGTAYTGPLIGVAFGAVWSGFVGDRLTIWLARRNNGIREPEHRLWMLSPSLIMVPGGLLLWGVGAAHSIHWFGLVFAMFCVAVTNVTAAQTSISYCIDSYKDMGSHAMVTMILIRNTMSFAVSYGLTEWVVNMGYQNAFIVAAAAGFLQICMFLVVVQFGKRWRNSTKNRYYRYLIESRKLGLVH